VKSSTTRRLILALIALVFAAVALGSLVAPHELAEGLGYTLANTDALNEFRAIYVGLWLATAAIFALAAGRVANALLGDVCALLLLGQVAGRLVSLVLDGPPSERIWPMFAAELIGGVALLVVRPSASSVGMLR
jgi:ABC-type thiamin/hydroxymethylpyrimidine transport system permease subunit